MPRRGRFCKRSTRSLRRAASSRDPYDRVLIVCEGSKTEPNYIEELRQDFRINNANLHVRSGGSAPQTVVDTAIRIFSEDSDFDSVFCMFDKDEHSTYSAAIARIYSKRLKRRPSGTARFEAITSVPCFEYWLLLHFVDTDAPFQRTGSMSAAQTVLRQLRNHIPGYAKGSDDAYQQTSDRIDTAIARAVRIQRQVSERGGDNPSTKVFELIEYLKRLRQR